ncbi:MAG: hypothetical protein Q8K45_20795 [Rubrivivax sp.]|nr:hypothetical protein [Rubrivivax sp.]
MVVDRNLERLQLQAIEARRLPGLAVDVEASDDGLTDGARPGAAGAEQVAPPGQVEAEAGVGLVVQRVVHAVHARRGDGHPQHPLHRHRQPELAMAPRLDGCKNLPLLHGGGNP